MLSVFRRGVALAADAQRQKMGTITEFNLDMYVNAFSIPGVGGQRSTSDAGDGLRPRATNRSITNGKEVSHLGAADFRRIPCATDQVARARAQRFDRCNAERL
jgi:hypothetical protein